MAQGVGIEEVIDIQTVISTGGVKPSDFGTGLLLTRNDTVLSPDPNSKNKMRKYNSLDAVGFDFEKTTDVYRDAEIWFSADPSPKSLYVAKLNVTAQESRAFSKSLSGDVGGASGTDYAKIAAVTNGRLKIGNQETGDIDFSGVTSWSAITTKIQTALQGLDVAFDDSTVSYEPVSERIIFKFIKLNDVPNVGDVQFGSTVTVGKTNLASLLGFSSETGQGSNAGSSAYYLRGGNAELIDESLSKAFSNASEGFPTAVMLCTDIAGQSINGVNSTVGLRQFAKNNECISAFIESGTGTAIFNNTEINENSQIGLNDTTSNKHVMAIYSQNPAASGESERRVDIAVLAKLSSQDFDQPQSISTLVPKPLNGIVASEITSEQIDLLDDANASVYTNVRGYPTFLGGKVGNGTWIDSQWWLLWLKNEMETNIFNAMRQSNRLTNIELTDTIHKVMAKAINTGGVKLGGEVNTAMKKEIRTITNNPSFNGVLQNGYLVWIQKGSSLTDIDRGSRRSNFKVWVAPSDAIHSVNGTIVLSG